MHDQLLKDYDVELLVITDLYLELIHAVVGALCELPNLMVRSGRADIRLFNFCAIF